MLTLFGQHTERQRDGEWAKRTNAFKAKEK